MRKEGLQGLHHQHPVCIFTKPRRRRWNLRAQNRSGDAAKTRSEQGLQHHPASHPRQGTFHAHRVQKRETAGNMDLLSAAADTLRKKRETEIQTVAPGTSWHLRGRRRLLTEIVTSRPLTEPRRLKGACARKVYCCTLLKTGATPQWAGRSPLEPNSLLCGVAWARPSKEMKIDVWTQTETLSLRRRAVAEDWHSGWRNQLRKDTRNRITCGTRSSRCITETVSVNWHKLSYLRRTHTKTAKNLVHKDMVGKRELLAPHGNCSCNVLVIQRGRIRDEHRDKGRPPRQAKLKVKPGLTKVAEECGKVTLFGRGTWGRTARAWYGWVCSRTRQRSPRLQGLGDVCSLDGVGHLWRCGVWEELPFLSLG